MKTTRMTIHLVFYVFMVSLTFLSCSRSKSLTATKIYRKPVYTSQKPEENMQKSPAEIPPPGEGEQDKFKIQIFASQQLDRAQDERHKVQEFTDYTIFLVSEKNLWKVQIGDFGTKDEAEEELDLLHRLGWEDAWLIQYRFSAPENEPLPEAADVQEGAPSVFYSVQLIATSSKTEAENMYKNLQLLNLEGAELVQEGDFWKIRVGSYEDYADASKMLSRIREMGFNDSWITKRMKHNPQ